MTGIIRKTGDVLKPPPIRYPLPTLVALILLGLIVWKGASWARPIWSALAARAKRSFEGPPIPHSDTPKVLAGPIVQRVLLLREDTPASDRPGGPKTTTIHARMFADVYDVWPFEGEPAHYRIGNRQPIGWVASSDVLPWNTRLVVRAPEGKLALSDSAESASEVVVVGQTPLPVLDWNERAVRVAVWSPGRDWSEVSKTGWVRREQLPSDAWGVFLNRDELLLLLQRLLSTEREDERLALRILAITGRLAERRSWPATALNAAREALPAPFRATNARPTSEVSEALARINEQWSAEASWGGLTFQTLPVDRLP